MNVEIIAEIATNHGGSLALAKEFIWRCAEAGADWVKCQHTRVRHLRPDDPQYAWFQHAEFSCDQFVELKAECERAGTKFLTTGYHAADVPEVSGLGVEAIKIGSGEAREMTLAEAAMATTIPRIFVSLGLAHNNPYESCFVPNEWAGERVVFLGCVTRYPAPVGIAATVLRASAQPKPMSMWSMTSGPRWGVSGWSDHAVGLGECEAAIVGGATVIEKHVQ